MYISSPFIYIKKLKADWQLKISYTLEERFFKAKSAATNVNYKCKVYKY